VTGSGSATERDASEAAAAATASSLLSPSAASDAGANADAPTRPARPAKANSGGKSDGKSDPARLRLCVVTRAEMPPAALIRFVAGPDDRIVPDLAMKLPGRGIWVTATRDAVAEAARKNLFAKSLKRSIKVDKDLADQVETLLLVAARQALAMANKAGLVTTGFAKVEQSLERGSAIALISASDASADGVGKLSRKFVAIRSAAGREALLIQDLTSADLGLAMGGLNVIHASLTQGGLAQRFISSCHRLRDYRMTSAAAAPGRDASSVPVPAVPLPAGDGVPGDGQAKGTGFAGNAATTDVATASEHDTTSDQAGTDHA
jgi:uncharacterized protein